MSQCAEILGHLKRKPITAIEALRDYRCFRLAARIYDLRSAGYEIDSTMVEIQPGVEVARYSLRAKTIQKRETTNDQQ